MPPVPASRRAGARGAFRRHASLSPPLTHEEKFWQLFRLPGDLDDPAHDRSHGALGLQITVPPGAGGAAGTARSHAARIDSSQRYFVERTRLAIPIIPFEEAVHGRARERDIRLRGELAVR